VDVFCSRRKVFQRFEQFEVNLECVVHWNRILYLEVKLEITLSFIQIIRKFLVEMDLILALGRLVKLLMKRNQQLASSLKVVLHEIPKCFVKRLKPCFLHQYRYLIEFF
jgi:hypothetical protein